MNEIIRDWLDNTLFSEKEIKEIINGIDINRNDECCTKCGEGHFINPKIIRKMKRKTQSIWNCVSCGNWVIQINEDEDCDCPLCDGSGHLTQSQLDKYNETVIS